MTDHTTDRHDADVAPGTLPPPPSPLEEEREFLLRSLEDLDREHAAGDVDDADYAALKDDYTARAAAVLRAIEAGRSRSRRHRRPSNSRRPLLVIGAVVLFAVAAGALVAQSAGRREVGEFISGDINQSITEKLNEAGRHGAQGDYERAIGLYSEVLDEDPANAEALAYRGWMQYLGGDAEAGLTGLIGAATEHPDYPDVHAFLAVVFFRSGLVAEAGRELDRLDALDPPPGITELTAGIRAQVDAALGAGGSTSTADADGTTTSTISR